MGLLGGEGYYARSKNEQVYIKRLVDMGYSTLKKNSKSVYIITQKGREYLFALQITKIKKMADQVKAQISGTSIGVFSGVNTCYILLQRETKKVLLAIQNPFFSLDEFLDQLDIELTNTIYDRVVAFINHGDPEQYNPSSDISWAPLEDPWTASTAIRSELTTI